MTGLRARLFLLVLLPTIPALLLALYTNLEQRRYGAGKVEKEAIKTVQVVAASQSVLLETTKAHLVGMSKYPQAYGNDFSSFEKFFATMTKVYPNYADFGIIETNGSLISSAFGLKGNTNFAERPEFRQALRTADVSVGILQPPSLAPRSTIPIAYPLFDEKGHIFRILYAALDVNAMRRQLTNVPLPQGGVSEVFDGNGNVLARYPDPQNITGSSIQGSDLFKTVAKQREGTMEMDGLDGSRRLYAFTPLGPKDYANLFVAIGILPSLAYSETKHLLFINLSTLLAVATLALLGAWVYANRYILTPIHALVAGAKRLGAGDLTARAGIANASAELKQLVHAFDEMATSLQRQRQEMERATEEIDRLNTTLEGRVTERTAQLADLNQQLESFSYSVSHDLRAPLRHISAYLELLETDPSSSFTEEARHFIRQITGSVARMNGLVEDLLSFARMGRDELRKEKVPMAELVHEVQREMSSDTNGRDIQWKFEPLPDAFVDRAMFKQVWANLLSNAVKYTRARPHAEITIGCKKNHNHIDYFVRDNGAGFDMKYADKLFGVFQRLHSPEEFEGTGIGLANVQRIVARHGGKAWAEGEIDRGATFWFSIPA